MRFALIALCIAVPVGTLGYKLVSTEMQQSQARTQEFVSHVDETAGRVEGYLQAAATDRMAEPPKFLLVNKPSRFTLLDTPSHPMRIGDRDVVLLSGVSKLLCQALGRKRIPGTESVSVNGGEPTSIPEATRCEGDSSIGRGSAPLYLNNLIVVLAKP